MIPCTGYIPSYISFKQVTSPSSPIAFESPGEITTPVLKSCIELTKEAAQFLHPKYSTICLGIESIVEDKSEGCLRGLGSRIGFLLLASAPVLEPCRLILGCSGLVCGALGTAAAASAVAGEKMFRNITNANRLDDPALKREALINAFTKRMRLIINASTMSAAEKLSLLEYPQKLIALSTIALAFNSRNEFGQTLILSDHTKLKKDHIETLNDNFKKYFTSICNMKTRIMFIERSETDFNWEILMECLDEPSQTKSPWNQTKIYYEELGQKAAALANLIIKEEEFQHSWNSEKALLNNNNNNNNQ